MAETVIGATSGWGHLPWLAPKLIVGFLYVFLILAIPWNWYLSARTVADPDLPFKVFLQYWNWIALDSNHLWFAAVASLLVGFFASDFVAYWNSLALRLMDAVGIGKPLKDQLGALATKLSPAFSQAKRNAADVSDTVYTESQTDAGFRVWLFSHASGAPVKYLDWHGFNTELTTRIYQALFLFLQGWILWGVVGVVWVSVTNAWNIWFAQPRSMLLASVEWSMILIVAFFLVSTAYLYKKLWVRIMRYTWVSLYEYWKKEEKRESASLTSQILVDQTANSQA